MKKVLSIAALAVTLAVFTLNVVSAQTATATPTPTTMPAGAPSTGYGPAN